MTERERLAELLAECITIRECSFAKDKRPTCEELADYLLNKGVICPPCKVGSMVYRFQKYFNDAKLRSEVKIKPCRVGAITSDFVVFDDNVWVRHDDFGKTVFLTREEAEAALAERMKA